MSFKIGDIHVEANGTPLVIPEIGINHGGDLDVAMQMVESAYKAGAKIIKHQTHVIDDEMSAEARKVIPGNSVDSIYDVMKTCALSEDEEKEMMRYTESLGMEFISTPFSRAAAYRLEKFGVKAFKIGSGEMNNYPLLKCIAEFGRPVILSTGMNDMESVRKAVDIFDYRNVPIAILHTTNLYPTPAKFVRLGAMQTIMSAYPDRPVGLSDHTLNNNACIAAMALGASIVERHYTDHKNRAGNDIVCSMDQNELCELLQAAAEVYEMRGGEKKPLPEEQVTMDFAFATVVSIKPIKRGEVFSTENIWVKRPGTGEIRAEEYESLLGKTAKVDIDRDTHISKRMIADGAQDCVSHRNKS